MLSIDILMHKINVMSAAQVPGRPSALFGSWAWARALASMPVAAGHPIYINIYICIYIYVTGKKHFLVNRLQGGWSPNLETANEVP